MNLHLKMKKKLKSMNYLCDNSLLKIEKINENEDGLLEIENS
jgi:hypothetical protein